MEKQNKKRLNFACADGKKVAYFRGRELHGKALKVPQGYRGVVVEKREAPKPDAPRRDEDEAVDVDAEEDEEEMPLGALETKAEFEEMVIWGHETMADAAQDPYVRSVEEWVQLSEQVRTDVVACLHTCWW